MMFLKKSIFLLFIIMFFSFNACEEKIPEGPERSEVLDVYLYTENGRTDYAQENNWENRYTIPPKLISEEDYNNLSKWDIPFGIMVKNDFDEAMDGKKKILAKVNIWPADPNENWSAQLVYTDTSSSRFFTLSPGDSLFLYTGNKLTWNQRDISGNSVHRTAKYTPLWIETVIIDSILISEKPPPPKYQQYRRCDTTKLAPVDTVVHFHGIKTIFAQAEVQIFSNYRSVKSDTIEFNIHYYFPTHGFNKKFGCTEGFLPTDEPPLPCGK